MPNNKRWTYLQVTSDVTQKRNVAETGNDEENERASKDNCGEERGECQTGGRSTIACEVLGDIVPAAFVLVGEVDSVEGEGIDRLPRTIGQ